MEVEIEDGIRYFMCGSKEEMTVRGDGLMVEREEEKMVGWLSEGRDDGLIVEKEIMVGMIES